MTPLERIKRGERTIDALCSGRLRWEMRVPAEPDHDPDLILSDALRAGKEAVNRLPDYEAAVEALERVIASAEMGFYSGDGSIGGDPAVEEARAALARLRESVPA